MAIAKGLAAKARLTKDDGTKIYIEVKDGSNFHDFFTTYTMQGTGRGRVIIPGIPRHRGFANTIEDAAEKIARNIEQHAQRSGRGHVVNTKIWIYHKRLYLRRLHTPPDILGLTKIHGRWNKAHIKTKPTYYLESRAAPNGRLLIKQEANP